MCRPPRASPAHLDRLAKISHRIVRSSLQGIYFGAQRVSRIAFDAARNHAIE